MLLFYVQFRKIISHNQFGILQISDICIYLKCNFLRYSQRVSATSNNGNNTVTNDKVTSGEVTQW